MSFIKIKKKNEKGKTRKPRHLKQLVINEFKADTIINRVKSYKLKALLLIAINRLNCCLSVNHRPVIIPEENVNEMHPMVTSNYK